MPQFVSAFRDKDADSFESIVKWLKEDKASWIDDIAAQYPEEMAHWEIEVPEEYK